MDKRIDKCAVCNVNMPKRDCPHLACGLCCLHIYAHKLIPAGEDKQPHAKRFAAAERAREELRLARAAALASAHKKATSGASIVGVSKSPLLALPSEVIDRIFRALLVEPKSAASLTKEHSKLFAAFGRTFHIVDTLRALEGAEIRPGATVVMIKTTPLAAVADSHIAAPCVLLHATIEADTQRSYEMSYALEDISKGEIRGRVAIIKELEVKCGCFSMHLPGQPQFSFSCSNCGLDRRDCIAEGFDDGGARLIAQKMHDEAVLEYNAEKGNRRKEAVKQLTDQAVSMAAEVMAQLRAAAAQLEKSSPAAAGLVAGLDCVRTWTQSAKFLVSIDGSDDESYSVTWCRKALDPPSD